MFKVPEQYRITDGYFATSPEDGNNGGFDIPFESYRLVVVASDGMEWEHVSVSLKNRTPNWRELCFIKSLFWGPEDTVIQYHPAESEYVNNHETTLHLWRPVGKEVPTPPSILVGFRKDQLEVHKEIDDIIKHAKNS